ncbi:MAG TPA: Gfo/Idh/MocA family oxidoreductase [Gemmataceae bacterium]|nr:Gfo/Idh/MocA family oxidoreductase [Gemmataceae bacterium]
MPTTDRKLRWGILCVAQINDRLLPAFRRSRHAELRAVASRSEEKARAAAKVASIPIAYGSYQALLDDHDVDAVYVPLPNTLHAEWTRRAAERGKHILCEKPLTPTAAEARELVAYCAARNVLLMDGFMWPHHPRTACLRKLLDDGGVGHVERVTTAFTFPIKPLDPNNIRLRSDLAGGSLLDVGCYPVYGIRWAFGAEPVRAWATARYMHGVDVEMSGLVWMADGRVGAFDCGFTMPLRAWMEITGSEGVVHVPDLWLPGPRATFTVRRPGRPEEEFAVEGEDQIARMIDDFSRAVLFGEPLRPAPDEAVRTLRVVDALARSAREGRETTV